MGELVVGHPGAERVDETDLAAQPRLLEHAADVRGTPVLSAKAIFARAPVDDVEPARATVDARVEPVVGDLEVRDPDERQAEAVGDRAVLPPRAVGRAVGQHGDERVGPSAGRRRAQRRAEQRVGAVDGVALGRGMGHLPVGELARRDDVGDPRWSAHVVLEDQEPPVAIADDVEARDARAAGEVVTGQHRLVVLGRVDDVRGHDARLDDPPLAVGVGDERVQGPDALHEPRLELAPLAGGDQPRDGIDEERAVGLLAEGDAPLLGGPGHVAPEGVQIAAVERAQQPAVLSPWSPRALVGLVVEHCTALSPVRLDANSCAQAASALAPSRMRTRL